MGCYRKWGTEMNAQPDDLPGARIPNGCVIGLAEEIAQAIARCEYGPKKNRLAVRAWSSFKQAGWQTGPEAGLRYFFDLHVLCQTLGISKRTLANMRRELENDGLFTYYPNHQDYATGWIVWNSDYQNWKPLQPGAHHWGRPPKSDVRMVDNKSHVRQLAEEEKSHVQLLAYGQEKSCTHASTEGNAQQGAIDEPKKGTEEEITEETLVADATQGSLFPAVKQPLPIAPQQQEEPTPELPKKPRKADPLWDKAVQLFHQPMGGELKDWRYNIVPELHRQGITPEQLETATQRYKREHPDWHFSFKAVFNHLGDLLKASQPASAPSLATAYHYGTPAYLQKGGH